MELLNKIHIDLIPEEEFSLEEFVSEARATFDNGDYLEKGEFSKGTSDGTFDSMLWVMSVDTNKTYCYIDFNMLTALKFKGVLDDDILLIKCWLSEYVCDSYGFSKIYNSYISILNFIRETDNFSSSFIKDTKNKDLKFLDNPNLEIKNFILNSIYSILEYIYFRENSGCRINPDVIGEYLTGLYALQNNLNHSQQVRTLPSNRNALAFGYYLDRFFNDSSLSEKVKLYYMPVNIWWKISTVIPIRPSEMCVNMERNCIKIEKDKYYLKVNRVKHSIVKKKSKQAVLPILKELQITKDVYNMIDDYIAQTEIYGETKTLFSWRALSSIRLSFLDESNGIIKLSPVYCENNHNRKIKPDYFVARVLSTLLKSFYTNIIKEYYKDTSITEELSLYDTRHYAFTSLLIQGLTPVEIALIGGHSNLRSQESYQCNALYYVDNEVLRFANQKNIMNNISIKSLKDIVFSKQKMCPVPIENCQQTPEKLGYCTCDLKTEGLLCEDDSYCFKCSKWWCEPTEDNFIRLRQFIKKNYIAPLEKKLETDGEFIKELIHSSNLRTMNDSLIADNEEERNFRTETLKLRRDVDNLIVMKKILLDLTSSRNKEQIQT